MTHQIQELEMSVSEMRNLVDASYDIICNKQGIIGEL